MILELPKLTNICVVLSEYKRFFTRSKVFPSASILREEVVIAETQTTPAAGRTTHQTIHAPLDPCGFRWMTPPPAFDVKKNGAS